MYDFSVPIKIPGIFGQVINTWYLKQQIKCASTRNSEARSRNHFCHHKAIIVAWSKCVSVS